MLGQVKISTAVNTFHFLKTERHQELDVCSSIGVVCQFVVVVETVMVVAKAQRLVPFQTSSLPGLEPVKLRTRLHEELHFHLLELAQHARALLALRRPRDAGSAAGMFPKRVFRRESVGIGVGNVPAIY